MNILKRVTINDVPAPTALEIFDTVKDHIAPSDHARFKRELRAGIERDAAAAKIRSDLGPERADAIERGLARGTDGTRRAPTKLTGKALFEYRQRNGGADPEPAAPVRGRAAFLNSARFGGHASVEEQRAASARERAKLIGDDGAPQALSTEATLQRVTVAPPGYGRQTGPKPSLPFSSTPPTAPSAQQAIERGSSAPPYALVRGRDLHGAALANFRSRFGKDPAPDEMIDPRTLGGGR